MIKTNELFQKIKVIFAKAKELEKTKPGTMCLLDMFGHHYENSHSDVLAYLLNPNAAHNHKLEYLNLFITSCNLDIKEKITEVQVHREYSTDESRRIDIFIKINKDTCIIIENKIYAEDQPNQLSDYYKDADGKYKNIYVLYLTLDGHEASDESLGDTKEKFKTMQEEGGFFNISYKYHIIRWLRCLTFNNTEHHLRSAVEQYLYAIEKLTGQTEEGVSMNNDIMKLLAENEFAYDELYQLQEAVIGQKKKIIYDFYELLEKFCSDNKSFVPLEMRANKYISDLDFENKMEKIGKTKGYIWISRTLLLANKYPISVTMNVEYHNLHPVFGIGKEEANDFNISVKDNFITALLKEEKLNLAQDGLWLCHNHFKNKDELLDNMNHILKIYKETKN